MNPPPKPFLTARWASLLMVNWEVDPDLLRPYLPGGVALDTWAGRTYASLVGFLFLDTRVLGVPIPYHRDFEEVNLRFYVRRVGPDGPRRGVVFVKELVPRPAIAAVARGVYGENYAALPMRHRVEGGAAGLQPGAEVAYGWRLAGRWHELRARAAGAPALPPPGSEPEFITEHYWGYARSRAGRTVEYQVAHPSWRVWDARPVEVDCDFGALYGRPFEHALGGPPSSAFIAEGSDVVVYRGQVLPPGVAEG